MNRQTNASAAIPSQAEASDKVAPYPFVAQVRLDSGSLDASALKLVMHGLMIELKKGVVKVGDKFNLYLELPANIGEFEVEVNVVRTIDRKVPSKGGVCTQRIIEVHFTHPLRDKNKAQVKRFLKEINQVGNDMA